MSTTYRSRDVARREIESKVYTPTKWLMLTIGAIFLLFGMIALVNLGSSSAPAGPLLLVRIGAAVFALFGGVLLLIAARSHFLATTVRHADPAEMPDVPPAPVIHAGAFIYARLPHELVETEDAWLLRPDEKRRRADRFYLYGLGGPFLVGFAAMLSWSIHNEGFGDWWYCILTGSAISLFVGGTLFGFLAWSVNGERNRLCSLHIPKNGDSIELHSQDPGAKKVGNVSVSQPVANALRHVIPRGNVVAVQLCPWKLEARTTARRFIHWAVQVVLVTRDASSPDAGCERHPLLLCADFSGTATQMQKLAEVLHVPYLFHADETGWREELARARMRKPIYADGTMG